MHGQEYILEHSFMFMFDCPCPSPANQRNVFVLDGQVLHVLPIQQPPWKASSQISRVMPTCTYR